MAKEKDLEWIAFIKEGADNAVLSHVIKQLKNNPQSLHNSIIYSNVPKEYLKNTDYSK